MSRRVQIREYVKRLTREFHPHQVILFGSCARGEDHEDSDVDLLVVMDHVKDPDEEAIRMRRTIPRSFPLDLIVKRSSEVNRRAAAADSFVRTLMDEGRVLYEQRGQSLDREGRRRLRGGAPRIQGAEDSVS